MGYIPPPPPPDEAERSFRVLSIGLDAAVSIEDIMAQQNPNRQTPRPPFESRAQQAPKKIAEDHCNIPRPVTGPTTRLPLVCRACGDALPPGAVFCIQCGAKVGE